MHINKTFIDRINWPLSKISKRNVVRKKKKIEKQANVQREHVRTQK